MTTPSRREYGYINCCLPGTSWPINLGQLRSNNMVEGVLYLLDNFDTTYTKCLADAEMSSTGFTRMAAVRKRIGFRSIANFLEWVNNNVPNNGSQFTQGCRIFFYDEVNPEIRTLRRVYGKNTRRASLATHGKYYSNGGSATVSDRWTGGPVFLDYVWSAVFRNTLNPGGVGAWTADDFGCFWFSGTRRTFYNCPSPSLVKIEVPSVGSRGRKMRRLSDGARTDSTQETWDMTSGSYTARLITNTKNGSGYNDHTIGHGNAVMVGWSQDETMTIAYPIEDPSGNQAVLLKPLGVDSFFFDWFDRDRYRLEVLCSRGAQFSWQRLFVPDTSGVFAAPEINTLGPVELGQMITATIDPGQFTHRRYKPSDMYFQLRDLHTNQVSIVSTAYVHWAVHRGAATIAPLVRNRPRI